MKICLTLSVLFALLHPALSQRSWESVHVSTSQSSIIRHSSKFNSIHDLQTGNTVVMGMYFKPPASQTANRVFMGLNAAYYHSGSRILGNGWAAQGNVNFPAIERKHFASFFSMGLGGIFMEQHFHPIKNTSNQVIGSTLNAMAAVKLQSECRFFGHWAVTLNGGLAHISNGAFRLPNIGINTLESGMGLKYSPGSSQRDDEAKVRAVFVDEYSPGRRNRFFNSARLGAGMFQKKGFGGQYFSNLNAGIFQHCTILTNFSVSAGFTAEYTNYLASLRSRYPGEVEKTNYRAAVEGGLEWFFDHIFLKGATGYYLHKPDLAVSKNHFYYRLAAHYCFKNTQHGYRERAFVGIGLKAYKNIAQHPELTGGYLF